MKITVKKTVVAVAATLVTTVAMGGGALAASNSSYTFVGDPRLFGSMSLVDDEVGWFTANPDQMLKDADGDGIYTGKFNCTANDELEFKVVGDGDFFAWNLQLCMGNPDTTWSDNQSQFRGNFKAGTYTAVLDPEQGFIVCVQDGKVVDFSIRYKSRDEDSPNYVAPSSKAIRADGYTDVPNFDDAFAKFKKKAVSIVNASETPDLKTIEKQLKINQLKQLKHQYGTSAVSMTWTKNKYADQYTIYRASSKNGTYKMLTSVEDTNTCRISGLKDGRDYYYKVRASKMVNGKRVYGAYSPAVRMLVKPNAPENFKVQNAGKNAITIRWKKLDKASGVTLYIASSRNASYKVLTTLGTAKNAYTKKGLTKGKKYYLKARSYKLDGSRNKVYSGYSKIVSITSR